MSFQVQEFNFLEKVGLLFEESLRKRRFADMRIICKGDSVIMANKTILAMRLAFFEKNFFKDVVSLPDLEQGILESVLEYVHTGNTLVNCNDLAAFSEAIDNLGISDRDGLAIVAENEDNKLNVQHNVVDKLIGSSVEYLQVSNSDKINSKNNGEIIQEPKLERIDRFDEFSPW